MTRAIKADLKVMQTVYYIPSYQDKTLENAEKGIISTINERGIWVRYSTGETGAKTNIEDLYI